MIHLKHILLLSFLLIGLNSFAQKDSIKYGTLEVKVIDALTKKPLEFASISIQINDKKLNKYSDKDGECTINFVPFGKHTINISLSGYCKIEQLKIVVSNTNKHIYKLFELDGSSQKNIVIVKNHIQTHCFGPDNEEENIVLGSVKCKVMDSKSHKPIAYAKITIQGNDFNTFKYSDMDGEVVFDSLLIQKYDFSVSFLGFKKQILKSVFADSLTIINFLMEETYIPLIETKCKQIMKPDEPTYQNLNRQQIMRMPH